KFAGNGETVIDAGRTLSTGFNGGTSDYGGVIAGAGNLRSFSDLTLSGDSTYTGVTTVAGEQVTLTGSIASTDIRILANASFPASLNIAGNGDAVADTATINNAGTLVLTGNDERVGSVFGAGNINLNDNTLTTGDGTVTAISGVISGSGGLIKEGAGTLTVSGTNTYAGGTAINDGVLTTNNTSALGTGTVTVNGGALTLASDLTIGALAGAGDVTLGANRLTAGGNNASTIYSGVISGSGDLTKQGSGEMTLTGANTYTGVTAVFDGTLTAGNADAFGTGGTLRLGGGDVDLGGFTITKNSLIAQNGTLRNGTLNMTASGQFQNAIIDAVLSGVGGVTSAGNGTTVLSAANTFTGAITAGRGTIDITGSTVSTTVNIT
ncbi:MAG TPA: autotransporter-associated beta strand repeat-containing protein, partial [candidate division Zixibacteria bacterium]|nr:autotransporter-associated beta strand repeat-containing protein [candidate division Zixibacteria bacterium]